MQRCRCAGQRGANPGAYSGGAWLDHPKFLRVRDSALDALRRDAYRFRRLKHVVFLCGGRNSTPRHRLARYLRERRSDTLVFYAEKVWAAIANTAAPDTNALDLESKLASLADVVLVIVESPGTFAELGAFSLSAELRKKLLLILELRYRGSDSFIETGPVRWVDRESDFAPSLWVSLETILEAAGEVDARLERISRTSRVRLPAPELSSKHLLFLVCDLVGVFGPCPVSHLEFFLGRVLESPPLVPVSILIQLARAIELVAVVHDPEGQELFVRPLAEGRLIAFHQTRQYHDISTLRINVLSAMQNIEEATAGLRQLENLDAAAG